MPTDTDRPKPLSESELSARYTQCLHRFATLSEWRDYLALAEDFHALGTYKDSATLYDKCVKTAAAPAYRELTEKLSVGTATAAEYREAARILLLIQHYGDARELARVYGIKANALTYEEAVELVSNSEATTEELGRGVQMLRSIKTFRDSRDLLERFEKYYFERVYAEAMLLMENGHVYSEFEEAAVLFEAISVYSDAAEKASACRKRAAKLRPKRQKPPKVTPPADKITRPTPGSTNSDGDVITPVKPRRRRVDDETRNALSEVWHTIDKRRMVLFILWLTLLLLDVYASIVLPSSGHEFFEKYANETRGITSMIAVAASVMTVRSFLQMLTASMRRKLGRAALRALQKLTAPLVRAVNRLLSSIGIDLSRRGRLGGRDERTFVFNEEEKAKKPKKRLKNELKWQEQPDNAARIRFIFIDYMIRRIRGGYFMKRAMTPAEIGREVAVEPDEQTLFRVYDKARYGGAGASDELTDALVSELKLVNQKHQ